MLQRIAERYGVTKAAVCHSLTRRTCRTNRTLEAHVCSCGCGQITKRMYASKDCYFKTVCRKPYINWRQGQRIARHEVAKHFKLEKQHIVHHEDNNNCNSAIGNLWVFSCHADHMSYHRGGLGQPIWKG